MSEKIEDEFLADTDLFFYYLRGGKYESESANVINAANEGNTKIRISSEVYDDAITALRTEGLPLHVVQSFIADMKSIPHSALPMSAEIAEDALRMYDLYGGRRRMSYFDSFHVATAKRYDLPLVTSDRYIINNCKSFEVNVRDIARFK